MSRPPSSDQSDKEDQLIKALIAYDESVTRQESANHASVDPELVARLQQYYNIIDELSQIRKLPQLGQQDMPRVPESEPGMTLRPEVDASHVVQKSMIEVEKNLDQFNGKSKEEMRSWLFSILKNNVKDLRPCCPDAGSNRYSDATDSPEEKAQEEEAQLLTAAIARIPIEHQKVITLRYHDDRSWEEIGAAIGKSPEAARKVFARAIDRLRVEMNVNEPTTIQ